MSETPQVTVIDYGVGNVRSVTNALEKLGYSYALSAAREDIEQAQVFILPGVGAFEEAMTNLKRLDIIPALEERVLGAGIPLLGICLGMQILAESSSENGTHQGLAWIEGHVEKIAGSERVPHVGWNEVDVRMRNPLFTRVPERARFYFDHSYHFKAQSDYIAATCSYGVEITVAVQKGHIAGIQCHPEKSQTNGLRLLRSFMTNALATSV